MSIEWADRIITLLADDKKGNKIRFLKPLLEQIIRQGSDYLPTEKQVRIILPMWRSYQRRQLEKTLGEVDEQILL